MAGEYNVGWGRKVRQGRLWLDVHTEPSLPLSSIQYTILHTAGKSLC